MRVLSTKALLLFYNRLPQHILLLHVGLIPFTFRSELVISVDVVDVSVETVFKELSSITSILLFELILPPGETSNLKNMDKWGTVCCLFSIAILV